MNVSMTSVYCLSRDITQESDYEKLRELDETYDFRREIYCDDDADIGVSMLSIN